MCDWDCEVTGAFRLEFEVGLRAIFGRDTLGVAAALLCPLSLSLLARVVGCVEAGSADTVWKVLSGIWVRLRL